MNCNRKSTTFESSITPQGGGVGKGEEEMEGTNPVVPIQNFLAATPKKLRARLLQWQNCPGRRALVTQIMSPTLTGKLMAETNGEWVRLRPSFFFLFKFPFFIGCCQEWDLSTQRYGNVVTTLSRLNFPCSSN